MSDAYQNVKSGRLTFKGGEVAGADKSKKRKKKSKKKEVVDAEDGIPVDATIVEGEESSAATGGGAGEAYTIDAAKKLKYEELFPVESKKFRYDPANKSRADARTVEEALDDRVRKKADRYCK